MNINHFKIFLSFAIIFSSCNLPNPIYPPKFKVSEDSIYSDINCIIKADSIYIEGSRALIDDTFYVALSIQLINVNKIPLQSDSLLNIQKKIARTLKNQLKDS